MSKTHTGKQCKECGGVKRYTRNNECVVCKRGRNLNTKIKTLSRIRRAYRSAESW